MYRPASPAECDVCETPTGLVITKVRSAEIRQYDMTAIPASQPARVSITHAKTTGHIVFSAASAPTNRGILVQYGT
jgi:hypothetical protein